MRNLTSFAAVYVALLLALVSISAPARSIPDTQWAKVQQLKPGTTLHVKTAQASTKCDFRSANSTALICTHGADTTIPRTDIRSISISHRGRSTLIGLVAGGDIGAAAGAAAGKPDGIINRSETAGIFGVAAGIVGAAIGAATDFTHSTIYRDH